MAYLAHLTGGCSSSARSSSSSSSSSSNSSSSSSSSSRSRSSNCSSSSSASSSSSSSDGTFLITWHHLHRPLPACLIVFSGLTSLCVSDTDISVFRQISLTDIINLCALSDTAGCFFNWYAPKKLKYVKPRLGESTLT